MNDARDLDSRAGGGDIEAWGVLLTRCEGRLTRMAAFRLHPRLRGRVEPADVVQEAYVEASSHRVDYFRLPPPRVPLFLWLRGILSNKLLEVHRHHLGAKMRDAGREVGIADARHNHDGDGTCDALVVQLTGGMTGPGTAVGRAEALATLRQTLASMDAADREVLALRHYEQLSNAEAAAVLGIQERAAAKRYVRALKRIKDLLAGLPGGLTGLV